MNLFHFTRCEQGYLRLSCFPKKSPHELSQIRSVYMARSHLTCCPKRYIKCFQNCASQTVSQTWPVYMAVSHLTCCPKQYLFCLSELLAQEIIPNPTCLHGPFSFVSVSKKVPNVFQSDSHHKIFQARLVCMTTPHLTCCRTQCVCVFFFLSAKVR